MHPLYRVSNIVESPVQVIEAFVHVVEYVDSRVCPTFEMMNTIGPAAARILMPWWSKRPIPSSNAASLTIIDLVLISLPQIPLLFLGRPE